MKLNRINTFISMLLLLAAVVSTAGSCKPEGTEVDKAVTELETALKALKGDSVAKFNALVDAVGLTERTAAEKGDAAKKLQAEIAKLDTKDKFNKMKEAIDKHVKDAMTDEKAKAAAGKLKALVVAVQKANKKDK